MVYFKFDKLDKIVISFTFIIVTLFCVFNSLSYAYETELKFIRNDNFNLSGDVLKENNTSYVGGFYAYPVKPNVLYTFENLNGSKGYYVLSYAENLEIGETVKVIATNSNGLLEKVSFTVENEGYLLLTFNKDTSAVDINGFRVIYDNQGVEAVISELSDKVNLSFFDDILVKSLPFVGVVVLFSLGVWFIKHNIIEHSKGRDF